MSERFLTQDVLSVATGRLLGDVGGLYKVISYLLGRDAFTHELAVYGRQAAKALKAALPELPNEDDAEHVTAENWRSFRDEWVSRFGKELLLPDSLRECLADDKTALETARELIPNDKIIVIGDAS